MRQLSSCPQKRVATRQRGCTSGCGRDLPAEPARCMVETSDVETTWETLLRGVSQQKAAGRLNRRDDIKSPSVQRPIPFHVKKTK